LDKDRARQDEYLDKWLREVKKYEYLEEDKESPKYKAYVREFQTMEINRIYKRLPNGEPYSFDFVIETIGTLSIPYIIQRACDVGASMMSRFFNIDQEGFDPKEHGITIMPSVNNTFGIDFIMEHQDHTFGNMIQTYLAENHMADQIKDTTTQKIVYVGYEIPHQLRDEMVLRIGLDTDSKNIEQDARRAFAQACNGCYEIFMKIGNAFVGTELERSREEGFRINAASSSSAAEATAATAAKPKRKFPTALEPPKK
jgi:DNA-directed RNA polymerase subunit L